MVSAVNIKLYLLIIRWEHCSSEPISVLISVGVELKAVEQPRSASWLQPEAASLVNRGSFPTFYRRLEHKPQHVAFGWCFAYSWRAACTQNAVRFFCFLAHWGGEMNVHHLWHNPQCMMVEYWCKIMSLEGTLFESQHCPLICLTVKDRQIIRFKT